MQLEHIQLDPEYEAECADEQALITRCEKYRRELGPYPFNVLNAVFGDMSLKNEYHWRPAEEVIPILEDVFSRLTEEQELIAREYFENGLGVAEIGGKYGVSALQANAHVSRMMRRLRHPNQSKHLRELFRFDPREYEGKDFPEEWYQD